MDWKYKIDLNKDNAFFEMKQYYGIELPEELTKLIEAANGASPVKSNIKVNNEEKVFGAILSFNNGDVDSIGIAMKVVNNKTVIPFAIDPFGNYFCYRIKDGIIVYWNHEEDLFLDTSYSLNELLLSLY